MIGRYICSSFLKRIASNLAPVPVDTHAIPLPLLFSGA
jgi:hypothetical protein